MIHNIRGRKGVLDSDGAKLYETETKQIRQIVKRNIKRFPEDFCFQLTESEVENLRSQFATSSEKAEKYKKTRCLPYVFTGKGIAMLALLLKNEIAVQLSIKIMNTIVNAENKLILDNNQKK